MTKQTHVLTREDKPRSGRAADDLIRTFVRLIEDGHLSPGDPLPPEREIVETYGVSRTVVREAVLALAAKGLVAARPRHRPVVRAPSFDTAFETVESVVGRLLSEPGGIKNLFDTRIMIEAALVRQAALAATREDITALKQALDENAASLEDSTRFYQTDMAFHRVLYDVPKNPVLPAVHKAYTSWLEPHWLKMPRLPGRNRENLAAHREILDAILMRDPDLAETALRRHLAAAWAQVKKTFE